MSPVHLKSALRGVVRGRKLWDHVGRTVVQECPVETAVNAVILEILVHAKEILVAVTETTGVENSRVNHRGAAGNVF